MKTGFTCAAGFNIVATATRGGRRLIAVVLGAPTVTARNMKAVSLFDQGFTGRANAGGSLLSLASFGISEAPDMHDGVCRNRAKANAAYMAEIEDTGVPVKSDFSALLQNQPERSFLSFGSATAPLQAIGPGAVAAMPRPVFTPVDVFVGPVAGWTGPVAHPDDYTGPPAGPQTAYATDKTAASPLEPSDDALPMKRGKGKHRAGKAAAKVAAHANAHKAVASKAASGQAAKTAGKAVVAKAKAAKATPVKIAAKPAKTAGQSDKHHASQ
jgi:D-alanyl-D-alanine carboxypeptidase